MLTKDNMPSTGLIFAITSIAVCGLISGYGTLYNGFVNGFFQAMAVSATQPDVSLRYMPGGPIPLKTSFTGIAGLDTHLLNLIAFFSSVIDGEQKWDITLSYWYIMLQFLAGWILLVLEGFRPGNRGRLVSWTGLLGVVFQNLTYTITIPIYLIIYLLTSPLSSQPKPDAVLLPSSAYAKLVPLCSFLAFLLPAIAMGLPSPSIVSPATHYNLVAFWQIFPILQTIIHWTVMPRSQPPSKSRSVARPSIFLKAASPTYLVTLAVCVVSQGSLILLSIIPSSVVPASWAPLFAEVDFSSAFVPASLLSPPTIDATAVPIPDALAPLARHLLQWDMYGGSTAILIWALYMTSGSTLWLSPIRQTARLLVWFMLGGPLAVAVTLLWDRDIEAIQALAMKKGK